METKPRTISQNRACHLMFQQVSTLLIEQGIDQRVIIEDLEGYDAPVTPEFLKQVFKTIMYTMYRKLSTTTLTTTEMTTCFEVFAKFLGEHYGIHVTWPSEEALYTQYQLDQEKRVL